MPEGHTIHGIARDHAKLFAGRELAVSSPQGRFGSASRLDGRVLAEIEAYGKHLFYRFDVPGPQRVVHVHLGLFGKVATVCEPDPVSPRPTIRLRFVADGGYADLYGVTTCALVTEDERDAVIDRLGPDPLRPDADPGDAWRRVSRSRAPIGGLLMDQSVIAGVGNVYRAELLYRAGLDPWRAGRTLDEQAWANLWSDAVRLLSAGLRTGRIITTAPADRDRTGGRVRAQDAHYVYGRSGLPCRRCGRPVTSAPMLSRTVYWCGRCQR